MKCDLCAKKATVHFTQLVDGQMKKMSFCEECAAEQGVTDMSGFGLGDALMGEGSGATEAPAANGDLCTVCGFTRQKFQQVGRLGCSRCYEVFTEDVGGRLGGMHRGMSHRGRGPLGEEISMGSGERLRELNARLADLIANENYEEAAKVRDEIQQLAEKEELQA
ncbi:MAG: UvrB/UvrC motif-containing protein [Verrucomicrobiota bacterium]